MSYRNYVEPYELTVAKQTSRAAGKAASNYRGKYLDLRKQLREYFKEYGNTVPRDADIMKAIGMK